MPQPLAAAFAHLPDPRRETRNKLYALKDVLTLATSAVIAGAELWDDIHVYAASQDGRVEIFAGSGIGLAPRVRFIDPRTGQLFDEFASDWLNACDGVFVG